MVIIVAQIMDEGYMVSHLVPWPCFFLYIEHDT